jgi:hypothetical protein
MKKLLIALLISITAIAWPGQADAHHYHKRHRYYHPQVNVSFQMFYDQLSPYGMWVNSPAYGYVWVPTVAAGFEPYSTNGYWAYTEWGWTWVSLYDWGWAPFHYGRWYLDPFYGYVWVPDNQWGPAWVSWRHCNGYYGWTALGPGVSYGAGYNSYFPPAQQWIFVRERDFGRNNISNYYVDRSTNVTIINNTTVINNTVVNNYRNETYIAGPPASEVQRYTGREIKPVAIQENNRPGRTEVSNNSINIYRPQVTKGNAAPARVYSASEAKPVIEKRNSGQLAPVQGKTVNMAPPQQRTEPVQQRAQPAQQPQRNLQPRITEQPQRTQPAIQRTEPVQQRTMPAQQPQRNLQPRVTEQPQRTQPAMQRTEPVQQRTMPAQQPQRNLQPRVTEQPQRMQPAIQRTEPVQQRTMPAQQQPRFEQRTAPATPHTAPGNKGNIQRMQQAPVQQMPRNTAVPAQRAPR